jgi:hypothetical protein
MIKTASPNPMVNNFKVSSPRINPAQAAAAEAARKDQTSTRVTPAANPVTTQRPATNPRPAPAPTTAPPKIRKDPDNNGGNGPFDYAYFQSLMDDYLETNQYKVVKRQSTGNKVFKGAMAFVAMVLSFLLAIYIAMQLGIIN